MGGRAFRAMCGWRAREKGKGGWGGGRGRCECVCVCGRERACVHVSACVCACMFVGMGVCTCVCVCVHVYVCRCVWGGGCSFWNCGWHRAAQHAKWTGRHKKVWFGQVSSCWPWEAGQQVAGHCSHRYPLVWVTYSGTANKVTSTANRQSDLNCQQNDWDHPKNFLLTATCQQ